MIKTDIRNRMNAENTIPRISRINIIIVIVPIPIRNESPRISSLEIFGENRFIIEKPSRKMQIIPIKIIENFLVY